MVFGGDPEFAVKGVVPDLDHVLPVGDYAVLDALLHEEHSLLGLGLVAHVRLLLIHADHDGGHAGLPHHGGELDPGGVLSGEASLAAARAIIDDDCGFLSHSKLQISKRLCFDGNDCPRPISNLNHKKSSP